jgi:hypothetical protein
MTADRGTHVPDLILEQYRLDELPHADAARIEQLLQTDPVLRARLEALEHSDADIARKHPPAWMAQRAREHLAARGRTDREHSRGTRRFVLASALVATAVLVAFVVATPNRELTPSTASSANGERVKGLRPTLTVYRRTERGSETLGEGAPARAGDVLRLGYVSAGRRYGVIFSIDGRGVVTRHLPSRGTHAAPLRGGGMILLDDAYELDDAPAWECFYFVTADHAFEVASVVEAARQAAARDLRVPPTALPFPRDLEHSMFSLQKEVRP